MTQITPTSDRRIEAERATLNPYKLAFRNALKLLTFPGHDHFLDKVETVAAAARVVDPYGDVVIWWDAVTQFIRLHPDVETFRTNSVFFPNGSAMSPEKVDALFRVAQAIDDGKAPATVGALITDFETEPWN